MCNEITALWIDFCNVILVSPGNLEYFRLELKQTSFEKVLNFSSFQHVNVQAEQIDIILETFAVNFSLFPCGKSSLPTSQKALII